jgi:hypothetical protein
VEKSSHAPVCLHSAARSRKEGQAAVVLYVLALVVVVVGVDVPFFRNRFWGRSPVLEIVWNRAATQQQLPRRRDPSRNIVGEALSSLSMRAAPL